jgi:tRNA/tmRNA/rRNA uracil-C5-methylase (TrmA/RlmC/RlmD family)
VVGVELIPEAVRDARKNAEMNGIQNSTFYAGKAEAILEQILRNIDRYRY